MTIVAPVREPVVEIVEVRTLEQWRQDLLAAADWLEANEWCQGHMGEGNERCAVGAIAEVKGDRDIPGNYAATLSSAAYDCLDEFVGQSPETYNDEPGRTKAEVIATMRACAMQP